jgi:formate hydrogenlyase subunit 3/multisubunit Na+/H+ antiporter MnhD subunit
VKGLNPTLFLILPLIAAFLLPLGTIIHKRFGKLLNVVTYGIGIAIGITLLMPTLLTGGTVIQMGGWPAPYGIVLYLGPLALCAGIMIYLIALLIEINDINKSRTTYFHLLFNLFIFASIAMLMTSDLFNMFVMMEIGSIAVAGMASSASMRMGSRGGFKYIVMSGLVSMLMLAAIGLLYSATGTLNIAHLASRTSDVLNPSFGFIVGLGLMFAMFFETEQFPFNSWVPEIYEGAPSSLTAAISGIGGIAAVGVFGRIIFTLIQGGSIFYGIFPKLSLIIFIVAIASVLIGEIAAFNEQNLKKMLGFSTVAQFGLILMAFAAGGQNGALAGIYLVLSHTVAKPALLFIAGFFSKASDKGNWKDMKGIGRRFPFLGGAFIALSLSIMGVPMFFGFWGKLELLQTLISGNILSKIAFGAVLLGAVFEGIYLLRVGHSFFEKPDGADVKKFDPKGAFMTAIPVLILALIVVVLGVYPQSIVWSLQKIAADLVDRTQYIAHILPNLIPAVPGGGL